MKGKLTFISAALLLSAAFTLVACGNDDESNNNGTGITPDGKVEVSKNLEFRVNFGDYDSEVEVQGTRAAKTESGDTLGRQYVELGNGLLAEVTVQKDRADKEADGQRPVTRALANDIYTMVAYKGGVYHGMVTGTVSGGVFTPNPGTTDGIILAPGTYDFVLFNSKVSRSGNNLTVNRANVETALIGRTSYTVTATPVKQQVTFDMKHAGVRMRVKLTGYADIKESPAATLASIDATSVPNAVVYDVAADIWSNVEGTATGDNLTFPNSAEPLYNDNGIYTSQCNEYMYFLPSTNPSKLKLKFINGKIYNLNMANAELNLSVPTLAAMAANGSYVINVRLMFNFLYLMSDGTTGLFNATTYGGGTKTPIAIVLSKQNRLAIALKDAKNGEQLQWFETRFLRSQNHDAYYGGNITRMYQDMRGYMYTWSAEGSRDKKTIKADEQTKYPAFYYAGNYGNELSAELASQGKALSGGMETTKWHLPSNGEWAAAYKVLGKVPDDVTLTGIDLEYKWYGGLVDAALTQVGGTMLKEGYWASTEVYNGTSAGRNHISITSIGWSNKYKNELYKVRPFVYY